MKKHKKGWKLSKITRSRMSESHKGLRHSTETKRKMRLSHLGKKRGPYKKKTNLYFLNKKWLESEKIYLKNIEKWIYEQK